MTLRRIHAPSPTLRRIHRHLRIEELESRIAPGAAPADGIQQPEHEGKWWARPCQVRDNIWYSPIVMTRPSLTCHEIGGNRSVQFRIPSALLRQARSSAACPNISRAQVQSARFQWARTSWILPKKGSWDPSAPAAKVTKFKSEPNRAETSGRGRISRS